MAVTGRLVIENVGVAAYVRYGYQKAATLGTWRIEGDRLTARVQEFDGFRITQTPLTLEIRYADGEPTRRQLVEVIVHQGHLSARLVPQRSER